ncbi:hypothetical protein, partial [Prevotellamassilia timonensis]|uniref:hypothetical protein n=1 Tax=Prevotellamassilia timonensis TaxID=1852370 RepID=UPI0030797949
NASTLPFSPFSPFSFSRRVSRRENEKKEKKRKRRKDKNLIQAMPPTNNGRAKNLSEQIILRSGTCVFQASHNGGILT